MASRPFHDDSNARNYGTLDGAASGSGVPFSRLNGTVSNLVMSIKQNTQALKALEKQVGTSSDSIEVRKKIQNLIRSTMGKVGTATKQLGELIATAKNTGDKRQQLASNSVQQSLNATTNSFNSAMERVIDKLKEHPEPPRMSTPVSGYLDSGELDIYGDTAQLVRGNVPQQSQQAQVAISSDISYLEERAERMELLEDDITQLHEMMGEIGQMVVVQGDRIDTIEKNTDEATVNVGAANGQLETAVKLKRCSQKLKLIIGCVVGVIATIVIVIIIIVIVEVVNKGKK